MILQKKNYLARLKAYKELSQSKPLLLKLPQIRSKETKPYGTMLLICATVLMLNMKLLQQEEDKN